MKKAKIQKTEDPEIKELDKYSTKHFGVAFKDLDPDQQLPAMNAVRQEIKQKGGKND